MSWLFSRALVAEFSEGTCSDGEPSAQLNVISTPHPFWHRDKTTDISRLSRFGLTYQLLTEDRGEELLKSFRAASRVRTSAPQETTEAKDSKAYQAQSHPLGSTWRGLSVRFDLITSLWRTANTLFDVALPLSSVTLPRWGMMRRGELWERMRSGQTTTVKDAGSMLPTPTCHNAKEGAYPAEFTRNTPTLGARLGGKPNPEYIEWMMGFPIGWTACVPLETHKFQAWQRSHLKPSEESLKIRNAS